MQTHSGVHTLCLLYPPVLLKFVSIIYIACECYKDLDLCIVIGRFHTCMHTTYTGQLFIPRADVLKISTPLVILILFATTWESYTPWL